MPEERTPRTRTFASDNLRAMSYEQWQDYRYGGETPDLENPAERGSNVAAADAAFQDFDAREGIAKQFGDDRAHVNITYKHPLANPNRERNFSDHEAALSMWHHYRRVLLSRDAKSVALLRSLAQTGNNLLTDAANMRFGGEVSDRGSDFAKSEQNALMDSGDIKNAGEANEAAEEAASLNTNVRRAPGRDGFTVVAGSQGEAQVVADMIDYALTLMPPDTHLKGQNLIVSPRQMPEAAAIEAAMKSIRPPLYDRSRKEGDKRIGVIAARGAEQVAVNIVTKMPGDYKVVPAPGRDLWNKLIEQDGKKHYRVNLEFDKGNKSGSTFRNNEKVVEAADQVLVVWNGDEADPSLAAAAFAARRGKLAKVFDQEGYELDTDAVAVLAMQTYLSRIEAARAKNMAVFNVDAASPEGRLGLSLVRGVSTPAINALSQTPYTLSQIVEMAADPEDAKTLTSETRVPAQAIRALADSKTVSTARDTFKDILEQCARTGTAIVGPADYPENLLHSGKIPTVLFVQAKDPSRLAEVRESIAFIGDEALLPQMAQRASSLALAVDKAGPAIVAMEQHGLPAFVPSRPSVLVLSSGHDHFTTDVKLSWLTNGKTGEEKAHAKGGDYVIRDNADTGKAELLFQVKGQEPRVLKAITLAEVKTSSPEAARQYAHKALANTAENTERDAALAPVREARKRIVENGGFVISTQPPQSGQIHYSAALGRQVSTPTTRTPKSVRQAAEIASKIADLTVVTQMEAQSPIAPAIAVSLDRKAPIIAINPPREINTFHEVASNIVLTQKTAETMPNDFGIGVRWAGYAERFAGRKIAAPSGDDMDKAAARIVRFFENPKEQTVKTAETKQTAAAKRAPQHELD